MNSSQLSWIAGNISNIADDVLFDLYVRGKYRDFIVPMTILRRLGAVLDLTKKAVLNLKTALDKLRIVNQDAALQQLQARITRKRWEGGMKSVSSGAREILGLVFHLAGEYVHGR